MSKPKFHPEGYAKDSDVLQKQAARVLKRGKQELAIADRLLDPNPAPPPETPMSKPKQYARTETVHALQWQQNNAGALQEFTRSKVFVMGEVGPRRVPGHIWVDNVQLALAPGDWVVWHAARGFWKVSNEDFARIYKPTPEGQGDGDE